MAPNRHLKGSPDGKGGQFKKTPTPTTITKNTNLSLKPDNETMLDDWEITTKFKSTKDTSKVIVDDDGQIYVRCDEHGLLGPYGSKNFAWRIADGHARKVHGAAYAGADAAIEPYDPNDGRD